MAPTCPLNSVCLMSAQNAHGFTLLEGDSQCSWATSARTPSAGHLEQGVPAAPSPCSLCRYPSDCASTKHTDVQWEHLGLQVIWEHCFIRSTQRHSTVCFGAKDVLPKGTGALKKGKEGLGKLIACPWVLNFRDQVGSFRWRKAGSPYTRNGNNNTRPSALRDYCFWLSSGSGLGQEGNRRGCDCQQNRTEGLARLSLWAKFKIDTDELQKHFLGANKTNKKPKKPETNNQTIQDPTLVMKESCDLSSLGGFEKVLLHWPKWPWVLDHPVTVFQVLRSAELCCF